MSDLKTIPRKPVYDVTDAWGDPTELSPRSATIRVVPQDGKDQRTAMPQDDSVDDLVPALSRVNLGQPPHLDNADSPTSASRNSPKQEFKIPRKSLDKPLPDTPRDSPRPDSGIHQPTSFDPTVGQSPTEQFYGKSKSDVQRDLGLNGVLDLNDSEDTTYHKKFVPAVTHETIRQDVHEVIHEEVTREIHTHDIYHRILPIHEVEVLPARHYIQMEDGTRREVPAEQMVSREKAKLTQVLLEECFKDTLPKSDNLVGPRQFSARSFPGSEGDYREQKLPDGSLQTERTWVHPPTLQTGGEMTGQTRAFHFDHGTQPSQRNQR